MKLQNEIRETKRAGLALAPYRITKPGAGDDLVVPAAASGDKLNGITGQMSTDVGDICSVAIGGIVPVEYGGNVADGDLLTSDADGKAVVATPGVAAVRVIGQAREAGDAGTIGSCLIAPSLIPAA